MKIVLENAMLTKSVMIGEGEMGIEVRGASFGGVVVTRVDQGSWAEQAGLLPGDLLGAR